MPCLVGGEACGSFYFVGGVGFDMRRWRFEDGVGMVWFIFLSSRKSKFSLFGRNVSCGYFKPTLLRQTTESFRIRKWYFSPSSV
jgi:hypothetical protein